MSKYSDALSLDGQNCTACLSKKSVKNSPMNLNSSTITLSRRRLKRFLKKHITLPKINLEKAQYKLDPPISVLPAAKCTYPPIPINKIPINNRKVLIVGGAKGLGKATAEYLSHKGFDVIATSSHPNCYKPLHKDAKYRLSKIPLDIREENSVNRFFNMEISGGLDSMILFPGIHGGGILSDYTGDDLKNALELKVFGFHRCVHAAIPFLRKGNNPRIISCSSFNGGSSYGGVFDSCYAISNAALVIWNDNLMTEERLLYGAGEINNPITFTLLEPVVLKSTIGLYQYFCPHNETEDSNVWLNSSMSVIGAIQAGGMPNIFPAYDPKYIGVDIYNILRSPQPSVRYISGPKDALGFKGPGNLIPYPELHQYYNTISPDALLNEYTIPISVGGLNTSTINNAKDISLKIYFDE